MAKLTKETFLESLKEMNIKEVMELVEALKEEYGIDPSAVAAAPAAAAVEEKTSFDVELTSFGSSKVGVIKAVKSATGAGLMDAKKMVESAPVIVKEDMSKDDAEALKAELEAAGATITLK